MRTIYPLHRLNIGFRTEFCDGYLYWQTSKEGWSAQGSKHCDNLHQKWG